MSNSGTDTVKFTEAENLALEIISGLDYDLYKEVRYSLIEDGDTSETSHIISILKEVVARSQLDSNFVNSILGEND